MEQSTLIFYVIINKRTALLGTAEGEHEDKLWIGLNLNSEHGWQWSNGNPYRYLNWDSGRFSFHQNTFCCFSANTKINITICL